MPSVVQSNRKEDGGDAKGARSMEVTMSMSNSTRFDVTRGADVFRGSKLLAHFDGADALEQARAYADQAPGRYVRYWGVKEGE